MERNVWVTIRGLHSVDEEAQEPVEITSSGEYFLRGGKHHILYDELDPETNQIQKNHVKIGDGIVEIMKNGPTPTRMVFEQGKTHLSDYQTPYGPITVGFHANEIYLKQQDTKMDLQLNYTLEMEGDPFSECALSISIKEKN